MPQPLPVDFLKPAKFVASGYVESFRRRFMLNSANSHRRSVRPATVGDTPAEVYAVDDYVRTDLRYCFSGEVENASLAPVIAQSPLVVIQATSPLVPPCSSREI